MTRIDVPAAVPPQPPQWTLMEFTADAEHAKQVAGQLAQCLAAGQWYIDFRTETEVFVVFAGHVERYDRADAPGRARAQAYAIGLGIPLAQLDWGE